MTCPSAVPTTKRLGWWGCHTAHSAVQPMAHRVASFSRSAWDITTEASRSPGEQRGGEGDEERRGGGNGGVTCVRIGIKREGICWGGGQMPELGGGERRVSGLCEGGGGWVGGREAEGERGAERRGSEGEEREE